MSRGEKKEQPANLLLDSSHEQQIRSRAYALYEERGKGDGHDLDDWLRAEAELKRLAASAAV